MSQCNSGSLKTLKYYWQIATGFCRLGSFYFIVIYDQTMSLNDMKSAVRMRKKESKASEASSNQNKVVTRSTFIHFSTFQVELKRFMSQADKLRRQQRWTLPGAKVEKGTIFFNKICQTNSRIDQKSEIFKFINGAGTYWLKKFYHNDL